MKMENDDVRLTMAIAMAMTMTTTMEDDDDLWRWQRTMGAGWWRYIFQWGQGLNWRRILAHVAHLGCAPIVAATNQTSIIIHVIPPSHQISKHEYNVWDTIACCWQPLWEIIRFEQKLVGILRRYSIYNCLRLGHFCKANSKIRSTFGTCSDRCNSQSKKSPWTEIPGISMREQWSSIHNPFSIPIATWVHFWPVRTSWWNDIPEAGSSGIKHL